MIHHVPDFDLTIPETHIVAGSAGCCRTSERAAIAHTETLLTALVGVSIREQCECGERPQCGFEVVANA